MTSDELVLSDDQLHFPVRPEAARPYAAECMCCELDVRPQSDAQVALHMSEHDEQPSGLHAVDDEQPAPVVACDGSMTCACPTCEAVVKLRVRRGVRNPPKGLPGRRAA